MPQRGATVRRARLGDLDQMAATAVAAWREGFRGIVPDEIDPVEAWRPDRIEARLKAPDDGRLILVAELDGAICALATLGPSRERDAADLEGELVALYVHPGHWREGIGRGLVDAVLEHLRAAGFTEAIVWTLAESPRNLAFYEALGFRLDGGEQRRASLGNALEARLRRPLEG